MKVFHFQLFTLMITLVFGYGSTNHNEAEMLKDIRHEAKNAEKNMCKNRDVWVKKISKKQQTCVPKFFCLAEKALDVKEPDLSNLTRQLKQYNKLTENADCHLPDIGEIKLQKLLEDVEKCVNHTLNKKAQ